MKKFNKILLAALPALSVAPIVATATSCNLQSNVRTLTYLEASEWVQNNYGDTSTEYDITKAESTWFLTGYIFGYGVTGVDAGGCTTYLYNELDKILSTFSKASVDTCKLTEIDRPGAIGNPGETRICALGDINFSTATLPTQKVSVENTGKYKAISAANFYDVMNEFFNGVSKYNADYIVNDKTKTLTVQGSLAYFDKDDIQIGTSGTTIKIPNISLSFDSKGRMTEANFNFDLDGIGMYASIGGTSAQYETFKIDSGSSMNFKYTY